MCMIDISELGSVYTLRLTYRNRGASKLFVWGFFALFLFWIFSLQFFSDVNMTKDFISVPENLISV